VRIDVVTIFPEYLRPLDLSLPGKAQARGLLDLRVHDLRDSATDRHRTVDDTPYGGGAGMVMRPEPWGAALDAILDEAADRTGTRAQGPAADRSARPVVVVPTPSGVRFTQALAVELAAEPWLVLACGRYEGIDQRVVDHTATRARVVELSLGDYVLNGGEVAALAVVEAVARLLPGFMGNAESLVHESHGDDRLLEGPVYTKPESWRGLDVPPVLLSGDHARIAAWRHAEAVRRTAARRPDLAHPTERLGARSDEDATTGAAELPAGAEVRLATRADAGELLTLQRACWLQEALVNESLDIPALHESLDDVRAELDRWLTFVVRAEGRLVASVRGRQDGATWFVGRLMVAPDLQGHGLGRLLLERIEAAAPEGTDSVALVTGVRSEGNQRMYRRAGYRLEREQPDPRVVAMRKRRR
jgi:tRNA (guanine37-N1)-methyltransferase